MNKTEGAQNKTLAAIQSELGLFNAAGLSEESGPLSIPMPYENDVCLIEDTRVAGTTHVPGIELLISSLAKDTELRFERDCHNLTDVWAIKVFSGNDCLGYIPCDCNEILARLMDGGKRISGKFIYAEKLGNWHKLHLKVYLHD